jgi:uncharacterized cupin superfamily protein
VTEAKLERNESGLAPTTEGWFVVNVRDAAWIDHDRFGAGTVFESPAARFEQVGINVRVLMPGQPNGLYPSELHRQEGILVLAGECTLLVEEQERTLRAWDFVHLPPGTHHITVGAGDGPCVVVMVGFRGTRGLRYPVSELARRYGAGVEAETSEPDEAYAGSDPPKLARPAVWGELPWSR